MKRKIEIGHTNISYQTDQTMLQTKVYNKFNHKIDYEQLAQFDFVPRLIKDTQDEIEWEWIKTQPLVFNEDTLKQIARNFKTLHDSSVQFPKTNVASRVKEYRKILKDRNIKIDVIDEYYKRINLILKNSESNRPLHNDLYLDNILLSTEGKIYFVDWEYATMGDKHFDLAYFICGAFLTPKQEKIFLDEYDSYWEEYLIQQKILVYYLTILWDNAQEVKPFDDSFCIQRVKEVVKEYEYKKKNRLFRQ
ncbi:phosphotransferase family protein [Mycoplasmopsis verecunda]|uniref:Thiamine kinase n=1 Tax=Mycoplasmopsis verecunda TaxID=171291 RepID=A0A1T4LI54_9BACT|nr:phosphotransferase [Mycoplasmopsis verecunda]WPB54613.1 phosphotransferase [Mycoplasmopsis verecunda]SJZ54054.1 Thiamine kinase [Mycoplasmopsis verecunda]